MDARNKSVLSWVLVAIVIVAALAFGSLGPSGPLSDAERASDLGGIIRCPQCSGQSVAESDVAIARSIRADIAKRIDAGESDGQIQQAYVDVYGDSILLTPPGDGLLGLVWVIPVIAAALAATVLAFAFFRWRTPSTSGEDDGDADADAALVALARER